MKLVKPFNSDSYVEDFGLSDGKYIYLYDNHMEKLIDNKKAKPVFLKRLNVSPVIRVNAAWLDKPIKLRCDIADTHKKKIKGLQGATYLEDNEGMFFPYVPYEKVTMHQASVPFSLDIMFIQDDHVCKIVPNTKVGGLDKWTWDYCTGVIEVKAGFCKNNNVQLNDRLVIYPVSEQDVIEVEQEKKRIAEFQENQFEDREQPYEGTPNILHLVSSLVDVL